MEDRRKVWLLFLSLLTCLRAGRVGKSYMSGVFSLVGQEGQISRIKIGKQGLQRRRRISDDRPGTCRVLAMGNTGQCVAKSVSFGPKRTLKIYVSVSLLLVRKLRPRAAKHPRHTH